MTTIMISAMFPYPHTVPNYTRLRKFRSVCYMSRMYTLLRADSFWETQSLDTITCILIIHVATQSFSISGS